PSIPSQPSIPAVDPRTVLAPQASAQGLEFSTGPKPLSLLSLSLSSTSPPLAISTSPTAPPNPLQAGVPHRRRRPSASPSPLSPRATPRRARPTGYDDLA